ncbi:succinate--CoA ligase subunit beta [Halanaerobium sp. MA284_MarDTE_T2]|uniref:succinate--CoA ligase subunit beta n=1 Tax=Halanaerobium sp. MA284_MarDTE_T2 TaxID=2183913 RepID=UPI000DF46E50|nr:succinate--CoA ligase subunit beta [Halanaerobium sp. MA284_MarDTE_T2]RCW44385.1 succinyl-CoA synthetase beta subunit [Halanaerobium sp. MA284_MarDTE_T2]
MRLYEYEAKKIFYSNEIKIPKSKMVYSSKDAKKAVQEIGFPVVVKSQTLIGGRGKAGGIKIVDEIKDLEKTVEEILQLEIKGYKANGVLIEEKLNIKQELYCGITIDRTLGKAVIMISSEGGIDIETVANKDPDKIMKFMIDPTEEKFSYEFIEFVKKLDFSGKLLLKISNVVKKLFEIFNNYDCKIAEINPIVITDQNDVICADAVLEIDDSALFRHPNFKKRKLNSMNEREKHFNKKGATYVRLDGNIGLICSGAGLGMATMDLINNYENMSPANFLETGGGITEDLVFDCMELIIEIPDIKGILLNLYGGINPIHEGAKGVARAIKKHNLKIPIVAKALGNRQEETWKILEKSGVVVVKNFETRKAVETLAKILEGESV